MTTLKLDNLRQLMKGANISAVIVPGTDPHGSEYLTPHWKERAFISGFTGSAGTAVITLDGGGLWTDSRYFLQAEEQLANTGLTLFKEGEVETPSITEFLGRKLRNGSWVSVNPLMFSINSMKQLKGELNNYGIHVNTQHDFINQIWNKRPKLPNEPVITLPVEYSGEHIKDKLERVRKVLNQEKVDYLLLTALDDIAWLFNIRGNDIDYNPVVISYAAISRNQAIIFSEEGKFASDVIDQLNYAKVEIDSYNNIFNRLKKLQADDNIGLDFSKANDALYRAIPRDVEIKNIPSPVSQFKGIKNATEIAGIRRAMRRDGVALCNFFYWLENNVEKETITELSLSKKLRDFRAQQDLFYSESFGTIAGFGSHGAIVHYEATEDTDCKIEKDNFLLIDSGAQYKDGTTDITRTVAIGNVSDQQKHDYTLVLKGHLALGRIVFPYGTRGTQLDVLARQFLWNEMLQYGHGTGHGVGHFLNVHEGPHSIRMNENPTVFEPGMVVSNEPGLYRTNQYGIRIENIIVVQAAGSNEFGRFLEFDNLTLFPYDLNAIDVNMLSKREKAYINVYHKRVYDLLSSQLDPEIQTWLKAKTREI